MEILEESKLKKIFKRYGVLTLACVFSLAVTLCVVLNLTKTGKTPVTNDVVSFFLPMSDAVVVKDFSDQKLQFNDSLKRWEAHLAIDLSSENSAVFSIYDGIVASVESDSLNGCVVKIEHSGGYVSIYSSLEENLNVKAGDSVSKGQQIGNASASATNESKSGAHLHFVLMKNGVEVDPNNYLDLQVK